MASRKLFAPEGMQDYLPAERWHKQRIEKQMRELFAGNGYKEVETPPLEYYNVLTSAGSFSEEQLFKTCDQRGRLLAVRPDNTLPIARIIATRMREEGLPVRVSYIQDVCQFPVPKTGQLRAQTQAGIELMGEVGHYADAEVIAIAIRALLACGLHEFQIDLGQTEFFKGLMEEAGLSGELSDELRAYVEEKNILSIELMQSRGDISDMVAQRIRQLPGLYGGEEVLARAEALSKYPRCLRAIQNLRDIVSTLKQYELADYISIDLGMVHSLHYYTGMIFRALTGHLGYPLLSGGRYDELMSAVGRPMPATGFALNIKPLLVALEREGGMLGMPDPDWMIAFEPDASRKAFRLAQSLRAQGQSVIMCYDPARLDEQAQRAGCRNKKLVRAEDS